jgi:hypothetical protein
MSPANGGMKVPRMRAIEPLVAAITLTMLSVGMAWWMFGFRYGAKAVLLDALLLLPAMWLASRSVRSRLRLWLAGSLLLFLFVVSHAAKIAFLAVPVTLADLSGPGLALLGVLSGWRLVVACAGLIAFAGFAAWAIWPRRNGWPYLAGIIAYYLVLAVAVPAAWGAMDPQNKPPAGGALTLQKVGGTLFLLSGNRSV